VRAILIALVTLESLALIVGAGVWAVAGEQFRRNSPVPPVFRPALFSAVIGDSVRYRRVDPKDPERVLGFLDYEIVGAVKTKDTGLGPRFAIRMTRIDAEGRTEVRTIAIQPELLEDGWMPPRFDAVAWSDVPGGRPVIRTIRTAAVPPRIGADPEPGFEIEAVIPREGLHTVAERYFISDRVPIFGVVRWERANGHLLLHRSHREPRRENETGGDQ
jgi:hypothetical protein